MSPLPPWTPDLATLDLLVSVAELGSVGRAATAHGISQPSASARLARLERQIGSALLSRGARGSSLTLTGEAVVAWAQPVLLATGRLNEGIATLRADRSARLRIAASLTNAEHLVPNWVLLLRAVHPELQVAVQVVNSQAVAELVRAGSVDVGFIESPHLPAGLHCRQVGQDRVTLVVARGYPLAARAEAALPVRDVLDQPLLIREPGSGTRDTFLAAVGLEGRPLPERAVELGSTATVVATAAAGGGIGVVSARAVTRELAAGSLVELTVDGAALQRPLSAVWADPRPNPLVTELIAQAVRSGSTT